MIVGCVATWQERLSKVIYRSVWFQNGKINEITSTVKSTQPLAKHDSDCLKGWMDKEKKDGVREIKSLVSFEDGN